MLSGLGVIFLPTTAKFAYLDGSNVLTVALVRGLVGVALLMLVAEFAAPQSITGWIALTGNGVAYCVAWVAFFAGAKILGATRASMLTLVEPPAAALGAWLLFGETYTPLQWAGFFIVLMALFLFETLSRPSI